MTYFVGVRCLQNKPTSTICANKDGFWVAYRAWNSLKVLASALPSVTLELDVSTLPMDLLSPGETLGFRSGLVGISALAGE